MSIIIIVLSVILLLIILLFTAALRILFIFDTENANTNVTLLWLPPLLKVILTLENAKPVLTVYIFNKRVYRNTLKSRERSAAKDEKYRPGIMELIKITKPNDIHVNAFYGFQDPFATGIACGALNIASQFINIDSIQHAPDFMVENDYIYLDAAAKVNIGSTLVNLYRARNMNSEK